jgi:hypothetical protein
MPGGNFSKYMLYALPTTNFTPIQVGITLTQKVKELPVGL